MANTFCKFSGGVFLVLALASFDPYLLGLHFSRFHNFMHFLSGTILLAIGIRSTPLKAIHACATFSGIYLGLGLLELRAPSFLANLFHLNDSIRSSGLIGENMLHMTVGLTFLVVFYFLKREFNVRRKMFLPYRVYTYSRSTRHQIN